MPRSEHAERLPAKEPAKSARAAQLQGNNRVYSCEFEFGEGGKLGLGSESEFDEPVELGLETNSYLDTHSPETVNSNSNLE